MQKTPFPLPSNGMKQDVQIPQRFHRTSYLLHKQQPIVSIDRPSRKILNKESWQAVSRVTGQRILPHPWPGTSMHDSQFSSAVHINNMMSVPDPDSASSPLTTWLYTQTRSLWTSAEPKATSTMSSPDGEPNATTQDEPSATLPCHLLRLPAELRCAIFEYCLAPGVLVLSSTKTKRNVVTPSPSPALLRTCKQIYREASALLYTENEVVFAVDAHDTCWPTISESRTPQHVLERLEHICVILDCTANFRAAYEDVDFTAFEALVSLKTLRIGIIFDTSTPVVQVISLSRGDELFEEILARIPKSTTVLSQFECGSMQQDFIEAQLGMRRGTRKHPESLRVLPDFEVGDLAASIADDVRGSKSGGNEDVFAEYHDEPGSQWRRFGMSSRGG